MKPYAIAVDRDFFYREGEKNSEQQEERILSNRPRTGQSGSPERRQDEEQCCLNRADRKSHRKVTAIAWKHPGSKRPGLCRCRLGSGRRVGLSVGRPSSSRLTLQNWPCARMPKISWATPNAI